MSKLQERLRDILTNAPPEPYTRKGEEMYHTLTKAADALDAMEKALREIAAFDDVGANRHLDDCGSYGKFDEPSAVRIARDALARLESA